MKKVLVALVCIASSIALTQHAEATTIYRSAGPFVYVTFTRDFDPGEVALEALCPDGSRVTGGGGRIGGTSKLTSVTPFDFDSDGQPDDGFEALGWNASSTPVKASVTAICLKGNAGAALNYASQSDVAGTGATSIADSAQCGADRLAGGGAWAQPPAAEEIMTGSRPTSDHGGWMFVVDKDATAQARTFTAYASCLPDGVRSIRYVSKSAILPAAKVATISAHCPSGFHVSAGGFGATYGSGVASVPIDGPDTDHVAADGWAARIANPSTEVQAGTVYAVCIR